MRDLDDIVREWLERHGRSDTSVDDQIDQMSNADLLRHIAMALDTYMEHSTDDAI